MGKKFIKHYIIIGIICIVASFFFNGTPSSLMIGAGLGFFLTALIAKFEKEDKVDEHPDKVKQNQDKK
ncbi:hypothetical protein L1F34_000877 [Mammaliicoccus lentus]|uniref:hypothetical protein n=1 Tax=Mammaliicoccus lentus TaxID=42858 RepID=UPI0039EC8A81